MSDFADRLHRYLLSHRPESKFALKVGVSQPTVNRWRRGKDRPTGAPAVRVAKLLRMKVEDVMHPQRGRRVPAPLVNGAGEAA